MKKLMLMIFLAGICLSVFAQSGIIRELSGTVELKSSGAASFTPASHGDAVEAAAPAVVVPAEVMVTLAGLISSAGESIEGHELVQALGQNISSFPKSVSSLFRLVPLCA